MSLVIRSVLVLLLIWRPLLCSANNEYASNKLQQIAKFSGISEIIDTIPDGFYNGMLSYCDRPLVVCVNNHIIEHIGYSLFTDSIRCAINSPAINFIERYSLELSLPIDTVWTRKTRMDIDNVKFRKGNIDFFKQIPNDSIYSFMTSTKDRKYILKWNKGKKVCCELEFPMHYDLIGGRERIELENSLRKEIERDSCCPMPIKEVSLDLMEIDSLENYYVLRGDVFYSKGLSSNTYYSLEKDSIVRPYYDSFHIVETLSNLFSIANYPNKYNFNIKWQRYGLKNEEFSIPVSAWVKYCINQGCKPYFGIIKVNNNCTLSGSLIMYNSQMAYLHAMKICFDFSTLDRMEGTIDAELTCYIMTSKIKKLFKEYDV